MDFARQGAFCRCGADHCKCAFKPNVRFGGYVKDAPFSESKADYYFILLYGDY